MSVKPEMNECHVRARLIRKRSPEYYLVYNGISDFNTYILRQSQRAMKRETFVLIENSSVPGIATFLRSGSFKLESFPKHHLLVMSSPFLKILKILQLFNTARTLNFSIWQIFFSI